MLAKQDDLARGTRHDCFDLWPADARCRLRSIQSEARQTFAQVVRAANSDPLEVEALAACGSGSFIDGADGAGLEKGGLEIVDQVGRVFDADAEADQVFRQVARGANGRIDRGVAIT